MGLGMLDLSVLSAPVLPALHLTLLAAVSHMWYEKEGLVYFSAPGCGAQVHSCVEVVLGQP